MPLTSTPPGCPGALPWSSADPAALARLRGVLTDIDDTLTRDGAIEPVALRALHGLADAGVPVVAITGRPAGWSEPYARDWPVAAIVAENGGVMLRRAAGGGLDRTFVQPPEQRQAQALRLRACVEAVCRSVPGAQPARDSDGRLTDIAIDHGEFAALDAEAIDAVVAVMRAHGLTATVSSIHVNGWFGSHSKWSGAGWAVPQVTGGPFEPDAWLYVGDSTNDQVVFERMRWTVGVANIARFWPALAARPVYVTVGERGVGFAEVADALLAARRAPRGR